MNTIHDLGGMDGFELPDRDQNYVFREDWEKQIWGLIMSVWAKPIGEYAGGTRADIERIPPELYIDLPYYAKWLWAEEVAITRAGIASREELADPDGPLAQPPVAGFVPATPAEVLAFLDRDDSYEIPTMSEPRFAVGDEVIVSNDHPAGHTRVPRYVRGHRGVIRNHHGAHHFQDDVPQGADAGEQHLYTVTFTGEELWGSRAHANDRISAELWESHLAPAQS